MPSNIAPSGSSQLELLNQISNTLQSMQNDYRRLYTTVETIEGQVNILAGVRQLHDAATNEPRSSNGVSRPVSVAEQLSSKISTSPTSSPRLIASKNTDEPGAIGKHQLPGRSSSASANSRIVLTTYPGQSGIDPLPMHWGHRDPIQRGPVVVSRSQGTIRRRNGMP